MENALEQRIKDFRKFLINEKTLCRKDQRKLFKEKSMKNCLLILQLEQTYDTLKWVIDELDYCVKQSKKDKFKKINSLKFVDD